MKKQLGDVNNFVVLETMNPLLAHIPEEKQTELNHLTRLLANCKDVEMVILFGSYARGTFVEDSYTEKGIHYEYKSDFDILVVTTHDDLKQKFRLEEKIEKELLNTGLVLTTVSLIFHSIKHLNQTLIEGNYFFKDIKKEGIALHDTGEFKLQNSKKLTAEEAQQKAQAYFDHWFTSANEFIDTFEFAFGREKLHQAAFLLHQAVERYYTTILLVFTDYRPKDHDLEKLDLRVRNCDARFNVFPRNTGEEKHLFELLRRAYIDARYKMDEYSIEKQELEYLAEKVNVLKELTEEICKGKIGEIGNN